MKLVAIQFFFLKIGHEYNFLYIFLDPHQHSCVP